MYKSNRISTLVIVITALINSACAAIAAAPAGFLFVTFKGEQTPMTEQIYFALSEDGRNWEALNDGDPVLVSELGERGVRDPYLIRSHDNTKFYLIATDLSINLTRHNWGRAVRDGSHCIVVWESPDLVNWSKPRLVNVAPGDAGCTWAPEIVYDETRGDYMVFWASTTRRDDFEKHRIWAARTKDFKKFSEPFVYIEKPLAIIDTTIVRENGKYYRFTKDETIKGITMETAPSLDGPWSEVEGYNLGHLRGYEGPECYLVEPATATKPATWCLILDHYAKGQGYKPYITEDLSSGRFEPGDGFRFPFKFRHGSVIPLTDEEVRRVKSAYGD